MIDKFKKRSFAVSAVLIFLTFSLIISFASAVYATPSTQEKSKAIPVADIIKTVRVGFPNFLRFSQIDKDVDGESFYSGLIYDYLVEIEKYTGWKFEFVEGDTQALITMLEKGEIDLMGGILKDKSVIDVLDFSEYYIGETYSVLAVDEKNDKISELDYSSLQNINVGVLKSATRRNALLTDFCELNKINLNFTYYDNYSLYSDLRNGKIDAILTNDISLENNQRAVLKFAPANYYFATTKGNIDVLQGLNIALAKIFDVNPSFRSELYAKYFQGTSMGAVHLSGKEKNFIKSCGVLNVAVIDDIAPISYFDKNGKSQGISASVLELISQKTELNFHYVRASSLDDALEMLNEKTVDLVAGVPIAVKNDQSYGVVGTSQYLPIRKIVIKNNAVDMRNMDNLTIGMAEGYGATDRTKPSNAKFYKTVREALEAVNNHEVDYMYTSTYVAEYYQNRKMYKNTSSVSTTNSPASYSIGMAKPANTTLLSILDKAIHSISENDIQSIIFNTLNNSSPKLDLSALIAANIPLTIVIVSSMILVIILAIFFFFRLRLKFMRQVALEGERYRILGEIADEYIYNYDFKTGAMTFSNKMSKALSKKPLPPNKNRGHENADEYLDLSGFFSTEFESPNNISELEIEMANGSKEWFRSISTVVFDPQHIPLRGMGKLVSIQREKLEKKEMESKINHDSLTQLYTGTYCTNAVTKMLNAKAAGNKYALLVIDIDHFKKINDNMGHQSGDAVLCDFAQLLKSEFEPPHIVGRWGGDEFVVFMPNVKDEIAISQKCARLCRLMDKTFTQESKSVPISLSIGICISSDINNFSDMFKNADRILYKVKNERRNGFEIYKDTKN